MDASITLVLSTYFPNSSFGLIWLELIQTESVTLKGLILPHRMGVKVISMTLKGGEWKKSIQTVLIHLFICDYANNVWH